VISCGQIHDFPAFAKDFELLDSVYPPISIIVPAYNEEGSIGSVIQAIKEVTQHAGLVAEILVVVDGATDHTAAEAAKAGAKVVEHPQNYGYGRSLKTGIIECQHDLIVITDADGTYPCDRIPDLVKLSSKYHMVVGARTGKYYQGSLTKRFGRFVFRWLSEFATGQNIPDINSGLRVFRRQEILPFFSVISSGFSFTTTCTLVYLLNDYFVNYTPIDYHRRKGKSKVRHIRDGMRALQIIVEAILRCNPIKIFLCLAVPIGSGGLLLAVIGAYLRSSTTVLGGMMAVCTSVIVLGLGFHSVAVSNRLSVGHRTPYSPGWQQSER
jgi:polyisoprenyl-phosphate glycosyltransferase